jgi:hypothetical protein
MLSGSLAQLTQCCLNTFINMTKTLTSSQMGKKGALTTNTKYPKETRAKWSARAGQALKDKYGEDYFKKMALKREEDKKLPKPTKKTLKSMFGIE